jgi:hypothetical protein
LFVNLLLINLHIVPVYEINIQKEWHWPPNIYKTSAKSGQHILDVNKRNREEKLKEKKVILVHALMVLFSHFLAKVEACSSLTQVPRAAHPPCSQAQYHNAESKGLLRKGTPI